MSEKRKWPRIACLERCRLVAETGMLRESSSRILNISHGGFLLEAAQPLRRGERVRVKDLAGDLISAAARTGTVRWCSQRPTDFSGLFEIGVETHGEKTITATR